ncbi:SDR family NAD(P)-dependent oxidoreductase [Bacillus taeanensis]|uniref:SDR family NAD(P)-dependent oxidoreductase n=1 Tax=Bacillus taeanensis TaxID=273032 RepID=A0A366XY24_9BACI|nr:SDR family NAD(P)-dependent oxidoreductase [Bacillus taeanensis]RBW70797.1 SDR family NAD(P)-dependent oxidoreductase [Bacillus taeanensis]
MSIFASDALKNEHILINGATGGIGCETAKTIAKMGAKITVTGRSEDKLQNLKRELDKLTSSEMIYVHKADLTDSNERERLVSESTEALGNITGLVNSVGITCGSTVDELSEEDLFNVMNVNYTSVVLLTQLVYKEMLKEKRGAIVNISSLSGLRGTYGNTAYAGSKFAMMGFTQSMAVEAIQSNIRVNAVNPGFVDTKMGRDAIKRKARRNGITYEEQLKNVEADIPSGRITKPEEVANAVSFLLTEAAGNIVGESLKISGGVVMR